MMDDNGSIIKLDMLTTETEPWRIGENTAIQEHDAYRLLWINTETGKTWYSRGQWDTYQKAKYNAIFCNQSLKSLKHKVLFVKPVFVREKTKINFGVDKL